MHLSIKLPMLLPQELLLRVRLPLPLLRMRLLWLKPMPMMLRPPLLLRLMLKLMLPRGKHTKGRFLNKPGLMPELQKLLRLTPSQSQLLWQPLQLKHNGRRQKPLRPKLSQLPMVLRSKPPSAGRPPAAID